MERAPPGEEPLQSAIRLLVPCENAVRDYAPTFPLYWIAWAECGGRREPCLVFQPSCLFSIRWLHAGLQEEMPHKKRNHGLPEEAVVVLRGSPNLEPCRKFRKVSAARFVAHLNEGKCERCSAFKVLPRAVHPA